MVVKIGAQYIQLSDYSSNGFKKVGDEWRIILNHNNGNTLEISIGFDTIEDAIECCSQIYQVYYGKRIPTVEVS